MIEIMFIDQPSDWNNLYNMTNMTTRCCWSECTFFNQSECRNLNETNKISQIEQVIQNRTGSYTLPSLYISISSINRLTI